MRPMLGLTLTKVLHFQQVSETLGTMTELQQSHSSYQGGQAPTLPRVSLSAAMVSCRTAFVGQRSPGQERAQPQAGPQPVGAARGSGAAGSESPFPATLIPLRNKLPPLVTGARSVPKQRGDYSGY